MDDPLLLMLAKRRLTQYRQQICLPGLEAEIARPEKLMFSTLSIET